jgi:peptidoglycan/LPS O-acetylase OafA/YrhL
MHSRTADTGQHKMPGIEILRFIAAVAVLAWHYQHFAFDQLTAFNRTQQPFYGLFSFLYNHGSLAVEVFWCISGFIFFTRYRTRVYLKIISAKQFFVYRFSRLYPLHFVTLIMVLVLQLLYVHLKSHYFIYTGNDLLHFIQQLFLASDWFSGASGFNGPIWSVSIEILVYFLFFIVVRWISKSILINIAIIAISLCISWLLHVDSLVNNCIYYFYAGGFIAIMLEDAERSNYLEKTLRVLTVCVTAVIFFIKIFTPVRTGLTGFLLSPAVLIPLLIFFAAQKINLPSPYQRVIETFGNMTYSSYLLHFPLQLVIVLVFAYLDSEVPYYSNAFFLFFITLVLLLSFIVYRFFEKPMQYFIREKLLKEN